MFKKYFPILLMIFMGFLSLLGYFVNNPTLREFVDTDANQWYMIIAGFAAFLGVINLLQLHFKKIAYKKRNWQYSIFTLLSFFLMVFFGFIYTGLTSEEFIDKNNNDKYDAETYTDLNGDGRYNNAEVLVLDEATSYLDGITEKMIMDAVHDFSGKKTIIIIAHRLTTVKQCDLIYLMENGKIIDQGTYNDLATRNIKFKRMAEIS